MSQLQRTGVNSSRSSSLITFLCLYTVFSAGTSGERPLCPLSQEKVFLLETFLSVEKWMQHSKGDYLTSRTTTLCFLAALPFLPVTSLSITQLCSLVTGFITGREGGSIRTRLPVRVGTEDQMCTCHSHTDLLICILKSEQPTLHFLKLKYHGDENLNHVIGGLVLFNETL